MQFFLLAIHGFNHELPTVQLAVFFFCFPSPTPSKGNNAQVESGRIPSSPSQQVLRYGPAQWRWSPLESITKNKHPVSFIKLDKPEIQHFVPGATRVFFLGKQTVPTLGPSCTGFTSLINAISFLRWDMEKPACMIILLTRYTTPSPWIRCAPIERNRIRNKLEWMTVCYVCTWATIWLQYFTDLYSNLFPFNAEVNWVPGSTSPGPSCSKHG